MPTSLPCALLLAVAAQPGPFYEAPAELPAAPGTVLRAEPFTRGVPDRARALRILYVTTDDDGRSVPASGVVVLPAGPAKDHPLLAWAHGTTGVAKKCAPSNLEEPFEAGALYLLPEVIARGFALVQPDYPGLGAGDDHPYLVGPPAARATLDAIRAAQSLPGVEDAGRVVVWGHSQGGHAALWTGILAGTYAPELRLAGVAALAPASDLPGLVDHLHEVPGGHVFASFVLAGYEAHYPDVKLEDYVRPRVRDLLESFQPRCLSDRGTLLSLAGAALVRGSSFARRGSEGPLGARLAENVPRGEIPAPLLVAQGGLDPLVLPETQRGYVRGRCRDPRARIRYVEVPGRDHVGLVEPDSPLVPELFTWTAARLRDERAPRACP